MYTYTYTYTFYINYFHMKIGFEHRMERNETEPKRERNITNRKSSKHGDIFAVHNA